MYYLKILVLNEEGTFKTDNIPLVVVENQHSIPILNTQTSKSVQYYVQKNVPDLNIQASTSRPSNTEVNVGEVRLIKIIKMYKEID